MAAVFWSLSARADLRAIHQYIAADSPDRADTFVTELERATERLALFPHSGRIVPEEPSGKTREVIHRDYRIGYIVLEDRVMVVGVWHGSLDAFDLK